MKTKLLPVVFALSLITACSTPNMFGPRSAHMAYAEGLEKAGLAGSALGKKWFAAAEKSLADSFPVTIPYREAGFFAADLPQSVCVRFPAKLGQRVIVSVQVKPVSGAQLFAELWSPANGKQKPKLLAAADSNMTITYEPESNELLLLHLQPELLVNISYTLTIVAEPTLAFPVPGNDGRRVGSFWGDSRDAGKRKHEGIDIFDKFRTPVVAAHDGLVTRVNENGLGGKVVWLNPSGKSFTLYYAHLDSQIVRPLQRVSKGDTLGLMGNTGNAKYTPTHLHFGIYANGAVDPLPFVQQVSREPEKIKAGPELIHTMARTSSRQTLFFSPAKKAGAIVPVEKHTLMQITGAAGDYLRVLFPDGTTGFIATNAVDTLALPLKKLRLAQDSELLVQPETGSAVIREIKAESPVSTYAYFNDFVYVDHENAAGWISRNNLK